MSYSGTTSFTAHSKSLIFVFHLAVGVHRQFGVRVPLSNQIVKCTGRAVI